MLAQYYIAPVANSGQAALAQAFVDLAVSPTGQTILANHGFGPAMGTGSPAP
jgi:ABC-type molybdate transport system substrate-binding protein